MALAIFDLDNTLIADDSDYLWGEFMCEQHMVDVAEHRQANIKFYEQYKQAAMDIYDYLDFALKPLTQYSMEHYANIMNCLWSNTFVLSCSQRPKHCFKNTVIKVTI